MAWALNQLSNAASDLHRASQELHTKSYRDDFQYAPLPGPSYIRLLRIEPGPPKDKICCSLRAVSLYQLPKYTALSYSWKRQRSERRMQNSLVWESIKAVRRGEPPIMELPTTDPEALPTKTISCNGKKAGVTPSLYDALLSFRQTRSHGEEYWIDGICMNQGDTNEKTAQVKMMGQIYQAAESVLVWFGECPSSVARGLPGLEALSRLPPSELPPAYFNDDSPEGSKKRTQVAAKLGFVEREGCILFQAAYAIAIKLTNRQWFKRIWVLQEFLLARNVVFLYGEHQVKLETILTAFTWVHRNPESVANFTPLTFLVAAFGPLWWSPTNSVPSMLLARQTILDGRRFTLREWLGVCKDRQATDSRDFIFGGLALVRPDSQKIDRQRLQGEDQPGSLRMISTPCPTPKGLWNALIIDHAVTEVELFVNVAACLLSQNEPHSFDLLSFAARGPEEVQVTDAIVRPSGNIPAPDLPTWVPALGSWTSHLTSNLNSKGVAADGFWAFAAGTLGQPLNVGPSPIISRDGTTLFLDAAPIDTVDSEIITMQLNLAMAMLRPPLQLLETLIELPHDYTSNDVTSFDAVATAFASASTSKRTKVPNDDNANEPPELPLEKGASIWLCEFIEREVRHWVSTLRKEIGELATDLNTETETQSQDNIRKEKQKSLDHLLCIYRQLVSKFAHIPWSGTADQGLEAPSQTPDPSRGPENDEITQGLREKSTIMGRHRLKQVAKILEDYAHCQPNVALKREELMSPEAQRYVKAFQLALLRQVVFRTKEGLIGMGPFWLEKGDKVMLVRGAIVPYVFRHIDEDLRLRVTKLQAELKELKGKLARCRVSADKKQRESVVGLEKKVADLSGEIGKLEAQVGKKDAWILVGEAYVEGLMRGEALERTGGNCFERLALV